MATPGWAIELTGEKIDLDVFRRMLIPPFDPYVEDYQEDEATLRLLLRRQDWSRFDNGTDVVNDANRMIVLLNGAALLLHSDARPLALGRVLKFSEDGTRGDVLIASVGTANITLGRMRGRARGIAHVAAATPPPLPAETKMQRWLREGSEDSTQRELLNHLASADNWGGLYKVMKLAEKKFGGPLSKKWRRIGQTANYESGRHAAGIIEKPAKPIRWDEAKFFIAEKISSLLDEVDEAADPAKAATPED